MVSIPSAENIVTDIIHNLSDNPNESGMSAEALKNAFDAGSGNIKSYLGVLETALTTNFGDICNLVYPVGSIYMSVNNTSPATLFGGTWEQIQDKFLLSAGSTYTAGTTGGEATHTLSMNEMPKHTHNPNDSSYKFLASNGNIGINETKRGWWTNAGTQDKHFIYTSENNKSITEPNMPEKGNNQAHNNMPPYLVVYVWKRIS